MLLAGAVTGLTYGIAAGDVGAKLPTVIATAAVQLPGGVVTRRGDRGAVRADAPVHPGGLGGARRVHRAVHAGSLAGFLQWLLNLEPFSHIPRVDAGSFTAVPLLWLLAADIVLILLGASALRRRDLEGEEVMKLAIRTVASMAAGLAFFAVTLFWPAGTFRYWQAWLFVAVFWPRCCRASTWPSPTPTRWSAGCIAGPTAETRPAQRLVVGHLPAVGGAVRGQRAGSPVRLVVGADLAGDRRQCAGGRRALWWLSWW